MALDCDIIEQAFSISVWRQRNRLFVLNAKYFWTLEQMHVREIKEPQVSHGIAELLARLLLTEGIEPNPGPVPVSEAETRLSNPIECTLQGTVGNRTKSPSFASFRKCLAQVSRDVQLTRTPGDGMNTPPPEPKPPDTNGGIRGKTYKFYGNAADDYCSPQDSIRHDHTHESDTDLLTQTDVVSSPPSDRSLDVNYIIAQARAESRMATNMEDDFFWNDSDSEEEDNKATCGGIEIFGNIKAAEEANESADVPNALPSTKEAGVEESEADCYTLPSLSDDSLDVNYILAQARAESRVAVNMEEDFYCNDSFSEKGNDARSEINCKCSPSEEIRGQSGFQQSRKEHGQRSQTDVDMENDFYTNSETSNFEELENEHDFRNAVKSKKVVTFVDAKNIGNRISKTATPNMPIRSVHVLPKGQRVNSNFAKISSESDGVGHPSISSSSSKNKADFATVDTTIALAENCLSTDVDARKLADNSGFSTRFRNMVEDWANKSPFPENLIISEQLRAERLGNSCVSSSVDQTGNIRILPTSTPVKQSTDIQKEAVRSQDDDNSNFGKPYIVRAYNTVMFECLQTRSLTVAKFRAKFNRNCTLLSEIDEADYKGVLTSMPDETQRKMVQFDPQNFITKERHRQEKLQTFRTEMEELNKSVLLDVEKKTKHIEFVGTIDFYRTSIDTKAILKNRAKKINFTNTRV